MFPRFPPNLRNPGVPCEAVQHEKRNRTLDRPGCALSFAASSKTQRDSGRGITGVVTERIISQLVPEKLQF